MRLRRRFSLLAVTLIIGGSLLATAAPVAASGKGHGHGSRLQVLLDGLSSPKGIATGKGFVAVGQGTFGPPGPILRYILKGPDKGTTVPLTDPINVADIAEAGDGAGWAIGGDLWLYRMAPGGPIEPILDIAAYQAADPDPYNNPLEDPAESNPYGLTAVGRHDVLLADAAGNDIIRVSPNGDAHTVARFKREWVGTSHLGDPTLPKKMLAEAVPTSIAIGRDGYAYVGQLVGYPGKPGSAKVWRLNPNAHNAVCSLKKHDDRNCNVWKSGFTSIEDLAFNKKNGKLYVLEIAKDGWLALEEVLASGSGDFPDAVLLEVNGKHRRELVRGQLSQPGGVAVGSDGQVFVTDGMFTGGRLSRVHLR